MMVWDHAAALQGAIGVPLLAVVLACCAMAAAPGSVAAAAEPLALKRVVLSSGGVGYFEHEATVEGDAAELTLPVRLDQVADVLKSIVVDDGAGGGRGTVSLPGREPLAQVFRDLPFGADALESLVGLLRALRGTEVRVTGARAIEGRLLGVTPEEVRLPDGQGTTTRHRVGVMTGSGAQQFILEEAASVEFVDPELRGQVEAGLAALATHRARDRRVLRIAVEGGRGRRAVRVAYVVAVPLWKSSYRLTLPAEGADGTGARLQGWAVIENMTGQDWDGVELTFLSGNPVTFRQDLYSAYYVDRPEVPVEVLGRVLPPADVGTVAGARGLGQAGEPRPKAAGAGAPAELGFGSRAAMAPAPPMAMPESYAAMADEAAELAPPGVALAAEAEEAATQVAFRFPEPVGVATGHSLMLPIIDRDVPAERLALYQPETHASHPLATVRLTTDGDTGLPPGVLTLYERGAPDGGGGGGITYVGDARLGALPAGEERLVSFALDQKTRVDREDRGEERIARGRISRSVLELTVLDEQTTVYRLRAPAREDRLVVIEHPRRPGWDLAEPAAEGVELTPGDYR
ncbi:MAG TPA: hypothetical protein VFG47_11675, partial [Geminicoccaceae bacterium]|nr:hypothetical protein [Geminicoccaceae bacterium]